jgi:hypothetical protein
MVAMPIVTGWLLCQSRLNGCNANRYWMVAVPISTGWLLCQSRLDGCCANHDWMVVPAMQHHSGNPDAGTDEQAEGG